MNRRILAVLISVVLAALGTVAVFLYVNAADERAIAGKKARTVIVADRRIPAGTTGVALKASGYLRSVTMPAETVPEDALGQISDDLADLVVTAEVQRGQLLLNAMFGRRSSSTGGVTIPEGMVAVAAKVKASAFGPGLVTAGARVAIFYTYTALDDAHRNVVSGAGLEQQHAANSVTRLLLNSVEVVAVGEQGTRTSGQQGANASGSAERSGASADTLMITFALGQTDAERLAHAVAVGGELNVALLSDTSNVQPNAGVDNRTLFG